MQTYLVELYLPRQDEASLAAATLRARDAARHLREAGSEIRFVRSIYLPGDETYFCVWESDGSDEVRRASVLAGLPFDRVVAAVVPEEA